MEGWKASHKKEASDTVCTIYTLKRQCTYPVLFACIIALSARNRSHKNKNNLHMCNVQIEHILSLAFFLCGAFQLLYCTIQYPKSRHCFITTKKSDCRLDKRSCEFFFTIVKTKDTFIFSSSYP